MLKRCGCARMCVLLFLLFETESKTAKPNFDDDAGSVSRRRPQAKKIRSYENSWRGVGPIRNNNNSRGPVLVKIKSFALSSSCMFSICIRGERRVGQDLDELPSPIQANGSLHWNKCTLVAIVDTEVRNPNIAPTAPRKSW